LADPNKKTVRRTGDVKLSGRTRPPSGRVVRREPPPPSANSRPSRPRSELPVSDEPLMADDDATSAPPQDEELRKPWEAQDDPPRMVVDQEADEEEEAPAPSPRPSKRLAASNGRKAREEVAEATVPLASRTTQRIILTPSQKVKSGSSVRTTRRLVEDSDSDADVRRSAKKTVREAAPLLSTTHKIMAGTGATLLLVLIIGYSPFIRYWHTKTLLEAPNLGDRKSAAEALFDRWGASTLTIFSKYVDSSDPLLRDASAYGLELIGTKSRAYMDAIGKLKDITPSADTAGKLVYIRTLAAIAQPLADARRPEKPTAEQVKNEAAAIKAVSLALLSCAQATEQSAEVRLAAVGGLTKLQSEGVCKELIKLASTEKGELRDKACAGIVATALPDAAPDLLAAMTGPDKQLAETARQAFVRVRDETSSAQLLPLVSNPMADVRRAIVETLGKRAGDEKAKQGVSLALKDKTPDIRVLAVKAIPRTGLLGSMDQLAALVKDGDESVRVANAETLAELRDQDSKKVLLEAFQNNLQGKTLDAYITALGKRSYGKVLSEIGMVMKLLDANPGAEASIREALVLLTMNGMPDRKAQRASWDAARWKEWYAQFTGREKQKEDAVAECEKIKVKGKQLDRQTFTALKDALDKQLDILESCKEKCKPDDAEDAASYDALIKGYTVVKDFLIKSASFDMRN
jgi:HEAT repeat protein